MNHLRLMSIISLGAVLLAACATSLPTPADTPLVTPEEVQPTAEPQMPTAEPLNPAVEAARQALSVELGLPVSEIEVDSQEQMEWSDGCLGAGGPAEICLQVITPGYRVVLSAGGATYTYHTNMDGTILRQVNIPAPQAQQSLLTWTGQDGGQCVSLQASADMVTYGPCEAAFSTAPFAGEGHLMALKEFAYLYAPFDADTPAGKISLAGQGTVTATVSQQRALAEWARLVFQEAQAGRGGAAWGLAIAYAREGGIAGFCDDVGIYLNGEVIASSCKGQAPRTYRLTAAQLQALYYWVDAYASFESEQKDKAVADAMTIRVAFYGQGEQAVGENDQPWFGSFAAEFANRQRFEPDRLVIAGAQQALNAYWAALSSSDYAAAAALYGGSYEQLQQNNPDLPKDDHAGLFEAGCTINGFVCNLAIKTVVDAAQISADTFRISIELQTPDSALFVRGPCCGADPADSPPESQFDFLVQRVGEKYLVLDLPIYVP